MKAKDATTAKIHKPFIDDEKLYILFKEKDGKIYEIVAKKKLEGKEKVFPVVKNDITKAFNAMEDWIGNIK